MTHTHLVGLPWTRNRPVAEASTCTTYAIHKRQTSMSPAGLEPAIPARERLHTYILDGEATEIGKNLTSWNRILDGLHSSHSNCQEITSASELLKRGNFI